MPGREDVFQKAMNEGHSAAWDQMWEKAAASYRAALVEFPDHPKALSSLGLALYQLQQYDEALKVYTHVVEVSPDDPISVERIAQLSEWLGNLKGAVAAAMQAAEIYLKNRDVDKAVENWVRVTQLDPEHALAHSRLAMVNEKMGHTQQAVTEYLAVASLVQRSGNLEKTAELVNKALQLMPNSQEARQAKSLLKSKQLLPQPVRPKGGTGALRMSQVRQLESPARPEESGLDPIDEARQKALARLAEVLFEYSEESGTTQERRGLQAIMRGTGPLSLRQAERTKVVLHLGQAIDAQTKNQDAQAAEELDRALEAGFNHPALHFNLGLLRYKGDRLESALRHLQHTVKHNNFALATRLLTGQIQRKMGRKSEASVDYLEALKLADSMVVPPGQSDQICQLYEPLIEAQGRQSDEEALDRLCDNIREMLVRPNWREHLLKAREQLPKSQEEGILLPVAEILVQAQSNQVLETINNVHQMARDGHLRSALDEVFQALVVSPTYLPLHTLIGDLLIQDDRTEDAIAKFSVVAQAYSVRGEVTQATNLLQRIIQLAPMDLAARTRLIEQLVARGQTDDAISEYLELADIYYRLAELDMARKTFTTALRMAQQSSTERSWSIQILQRMADIDMQRLDWKQAMRVFEQIRTLRPEDGAVRKNLVELNLRLGQKQQAGSEIEGFITYLEGNGLSEDAIAFLEDLIREHAEDVGIRRSLAIQYQKAGRIEEAVAELDGIGETLLEAGDRAGAIEAINLILAMDPPTADKYRKLLVQLHAE